MAHRPAFPPIRKDWLPCPPPELPLPYWMLHTTTGWLTSPERTTIEQQTGRWATRRAEAMVPPIAGPGAVLEAAKYMWDTVRTNYGIPTGRLPALPKLKLPKSKEEPKPRAKTRTPADEFAELSEKEMGALIEETVIAIGRAPTEAEVREHWLRKRGK